MPTSLPGRKPNLMALINAHSSKTGGDSAIPDLSWSDNKIAEIIGDTAIRGLGVVETQVQDIEVDDENPTNSADFPKSMNHLEETNRLKRNLAIEHNYIRDTLQNIEPLNIAQVENRQSFLHQHSASLTANPSCTNIPASLTILLILSNKRSSVCIFTLTKHNGGGRIKYKTHINNTQETVNKTRLTQRTQRTSDKEHSLSTEHLGDHLGTISS
ncbi:hypothetical protein JTB14_008591 [Gonioctena quinquepunctata]|nr:hypothetical protein JTB14_008591 [Gonioctena quinquepunctata]